MTITRIVMRMWVLLALVFGGAGVARAQSFFDFSYTSSGVSVMGTFVTTSQGNGSYLITNILNGMRGSNAITLLAPGAFQGNDNILRFPANPSYFSFGGFSFQSGSNYYNFFYALNGDYRELNSNTSNVISDLNIEPVPAPLPGGGLLSFLALGLAALIHRRRIILAPARALIARLAPQPSARRA